MLATEDLKIPPDKAKIWIKHYFVNSNPKICPPLKDRRLIELMPDIIALDRVQVDPCILVIYYCIIGMGCFFDEHNRFMRPDPQIQQQIYICCLRAVSLWRREAGGSMTDLIAAIMMVQMAAENFDFCLSWEIHKRACDLAQNLGLHNLDGVDAALSASEGLMNDEDRVNMWNLVQQDLFHRLINNKPPAFLSVQSNWRVNFPWLNLETCPNQDEVVPTMIFLARSRITLILMDYFQAIDKLQESEVTLDIIEPLCAQVEHVFQVWRIDEWLESYQQDNFSGFFLCELAISCYTCILFMLRRTTLKHEDDRQALQDNDDMIPRSALSVRAARKVVDVLYHMVRNMSLPGPESLSCAFGTYRAHVAYAHIARGLIDNLDTYTDSEDLLRLRRFNECVQNISRSEKAFRPLAEALNSVYEKAAREKVVV